MKSDGVPARLCMTIALCVFILFVSACAPHNKIYSGKHRSSADVAIVRGFNVGGGYNGANSQIREVDGQVLKLGNMLANSVEVLPGEHVFGISLDTPHQWQATAIKINVQAGKIYEARFSADEQALKNGKLVMTDAHLFEVTSGERVLELDSWTAIKNSIWKSPPVIIYY